MADVFSFSCCFYCFSDDFSLMLKKKKALENSPNPEFFNCGEMQERFRGDL